jgi:hypothetical protein
MCTRVLGAVALAIAFSAPPLPAQATPAAPAYELKGSVLDGSRRPLDQVEVVLIRDGAIVHTVLSGDNGRFTFGRVTAGQVMLHFRRLGYAAQTLELEVGPGGHPRVSEIVLVEVPSQLTEVTISTEVGSQRYRGFYERKQSRASFGRFLEHKDIRRLGPANPSDLFRTVPGATIRTANLNGNTIRIRGCQPMVWVDGQRVPGAELDEVVQPTEIGAIEFYPSSAGVPAQYMERGNRLCGLILVWTR